MGNARSLQVSVRESEKEFGTDKAIGLLVGSGRLRNPKGTKSAAQVLFDKLVELDKQEKEKTMTLDTLKARLLSDPEVRKYYNELTPEFDKAKKKILKDRCKAKKNK